MVACPRLQIAKIPYDEWKFEGEHVFAELKERNPEEFDALRIHLRNVPSDLYV